MKKHQYYIFLAFIFLICAAFQCEDKYPCETNIENIISENIVIKIEKPSNLKVNDTIWLSASINNQLKDKAGKNIEFKPNEDYGFKQYISLELKNNFDEYSSLNFGDFFVIKIGEIYTENGSLSSSFVFDDISKSYTYNFGLILKEKGTYRFTTGNIYNADYSSNNNCPQYSFEFPIFFENGTSENKQIYIFTVD